MSGPAEIAPGVWRCGNELVNWYLVEDEGRATVLDAGLPGLRPQLDEALRMAGLGLEAVEAVVLTHGHPDHVGFAPALQAERGVPVHVHEDDVELARTLRIGARDGRIAPYLRHRAAWRLAGGFALSLRAGRPRGVDGPRPFRDGDVLDVPGRPRVIHTPGHSAGECVLLLERQGALLVGDALCTLNPLTGRRGPQLMPRALNADTEAALASLARLEGLRADVLAPGHGEPWRQTVEGALSRARAVGPT